VETAVGMGEPREVRSESDFLHANSESELLSSTSRLSPFSYAVLVLVGNDGAGPHDLRRMADIGRVYWDAAPSQWYAEPKRLEKLGLLRAEKTPGQTRERTHYTLTAKGREAITEWVRTPAQLPRMQHESIVRLLAADLVEPEAVAEGLRTFEDSLEGALAGVREGLANLDRFRPERARLLEVNHRYAAKLLDLQRAWLKEAEAALED
jgi:DNA-binding PadR family transcriptional regulator